MRSEQEWEDICRRRKAYWEHSGDPSQPHVIITSEDHSRGYFNGEQVLQDTWLADEMSRELIEKLVQAGFDLDSIDRVIGPAMGAVTWVDLLSLNIGRRRGRPCLRAFAEKESEGKGKTFIFKRGDIQPGERALTSEDASTKLESVAGTDKAFMDVGGTTVDFYALILNRSGKTEVGPKKIVSLWKRDLPTWPKHECPLCRAGSVALRPKGRQNWARLNLVAA